MNEKIQEIVLGNQGNYIMPFFWQHGADEATLREYMEKIQGCGIHAVCLEARPHPDYVGPQWWHNVDKGTCRVLEGEFDVSLADYREQDTFLPLGKLPRLTDISSLKPGFSGIIRYETPFAGVAKVLDLGRAFEGVEVLVNGRSAGVKIGFPYRYDVSKLTQKGENRLEILVATSLGEALADDLSKQRPFAPEGVLGPITLWD